MSRTKRFKHDKWLIKHNRVLEELKRVEGTWQWNWVKLDPTSKEAQDRIAKMHSDAKHGVMRWRGPGWFVRDFHQVPYRQRARQELMKFMKNPDYEVQIESKPYLTYWY
jgi:hypothetical protein